MARTKVILEHDDFCGFPQCCASCLATENLRFRFARAASLPFVFRRMDLEVPICARCVRRSSWLQAIDLALFVVLFLAFYYALDPYLTAYNVPSFGRGVVAASLILCVLLPFNRLFELGQGPVLLRQRAEDGRLTLRFMNAEYAQRFQALNPHRHDSATAAQVL